MATVREAAREHAHAGAAVVPVRRSLGGLMRYVALFRGINVGKAKRIAMADLRELLERLGYTGVRTLLNSGNAIFTTDAAPAPKIAAHIRTEVRKRLGVDALVIVKSRSDIARIIGGNALIGTATDDSRLLIAVANDVSAITALRKYGKLKWGEERVHVGRHAAYLWCAHGILESKVAEALLTDLKEIGTTRNWATINKIHALMEEQQ